MKTKKPGKVAGLFCFHSRMRKRNSACPYFFMQKCKRQSKRYNKLLAIFPKSLHADNAFYFSIPRVFNAVAWEKLFPREEKTGDRGAGKVGCGKNITFNTNRSLARNSLLTDLGLMVISFYGAV